MLRYAGEERGPGRMGVTRGVDPAAAVEEAARLEGLAEEIEALDQEARRTARGVGFEVASAAGAAEALRDVAAGLRRSAERVQQGADGGMAWAAGGAGSRPWWATWWGDAALTAAGPAGPGLVAAGSADFRRGFRDELVGLGALVVDLVPLASAHEGGAAGAWGDLRDGLWWGVTNPIAFAEAYAGLPELREQGPEYWAGMMAPGLIAAIVTGGAGAAGRGASATRRVAAASQVRRLTRGAVGTRQAPLGLRHVFHGELNKHGRAVGFHHRRGVAHQGRARLRPGTAIERRADGTYQALVDIRDPATGAWVQKKPPSTFFPDEWSRQRVLDEIDGAWQTPPSRAAGGAGSRPAG